MMLTCMIILLCGGLTGRAVHQPRIQHVDEGSKVLTGLEARHWGLRGNFDAALNT